MSYLPTNPMGQGHKTKVHTLTVLKGKPHSTCDFAKLWSYYINKCELIESHIHKATQISWLLNANTTDANKSFIDSVKYLLMLNECLPLGEAVVPMFSGWLWTQSCFMHLMFVFDSSVLGSLPHLSPALLSGDGSFGATFVRLSRNLVSFGWREAPKRESKVGELEKPVNLFHYYISSGSNSIFGSWCLLAIAPNYTLFLISVLSTLKIWMCTYFPNFWFVEKLVSWNHWHCSIHLHHRNW